MGGGGNGWGDWVMGCVVEEARTNMGHFRKVLRDFNAKYQSI